MPSIAATIADTAARFAPCDRSFHRSTANPLREAFRPVYSLVGIARAYGSNQPLNAREGRQILRILRLQPGTLLAAPMWKTVQSITSYGCSWISWRIGTE